VGLEDGMTPGMVDEGDVWKEKWWYSSILMVFGKAGASEGESVGDLLRMM